MNLIECIDPSARTICSVGAVVTSVSAVVAGIGAVVTGVCAVVAGIGAIVVGFIGTICCRRAISVTRSVIST